MTRTKNSRKSKARSKKRTSKPKPRKAAVPVAPPLHQELSSPVQSAPMETVASEVEGFASSTGLMASMRRIVTGGQVSKTNQGLFSTRRTLGEWLLWFGGLVAVYYVVQYFLD